MDQKGRLALPSTYRAHFETGCYLTYGQEECIAIYTPEEFEKMANDLLDKVRTGQVARSQVRAMSSDAILVQLDGQGRITIDTRLRDYAGLVPGEAAVVAGVLDRVEIWHPDRFATQIGAGTAAIAAGA